MLQISASHKDSSVASSAFSSPIIGALLKISIISWSQKTGFPVSVRVYIGERTFSLHKHPLFSKSGYFKKRLMETTEVELPLDFPGGSETFEMIALFIYGSSTLIDPFNVAALRCAAEFLEMTEEYCSGNLCERFDLYLNQVVLQSWDDTLIVLQRCQMLLPWSEELLMVSRCIESLAFMACMEILDPERRRGVPVVTVDALADQAWSCEVVNDILNHDLWIKDLIALPFNFFKRIIVSLRRQGMKEKYVSPIIIFYANKWILYKTTRQFYGGTVEDAEAKDKVAMILQGTLDLLPLREKASRGIPVGFYFALLSRTLDVGLQNDSCKARLRDEIATLLPLARLQDFLVPKSDEVDSICSSSELAVMESIISCYVSFNAETNASNLVVAKLWDQYISLVASYPTMESRRFMELVERIPISYRQSHDQLYRAISTFLQKLAICKYLNCQKLSQNACIEAVQNELMPLRLIVQALLVQQLNTHQAFKECSDSFRYANYGDFSGSLSSSKCPTSKTQTPFTEGEEPGGKSSTIFQQKYLVDLTSEFSRKECESTSSRIQNLEQEILSLKRILQSKNTSKRQETTPTMEQSMKSYCMEGRSLSKRKNSLGQVTSCIGSVNFNWRRTYSKWILKIFRRVRSFGRQKSK
ncbi:hypothetical protein K2173_018424 [Erythroxylum novogranatense]|uniref:Phototropic-responsive NPH3 family protein n=1 Tax=Erythroxylum novogranatense TaxID=1862640 RepID=A0AAV8UAJ6_9ROSI|nr:hypothetical protein K2173_018424 [Erythroxylum novogranatense]